jgi:ribosomal protein L14
MIQVCSLVKVADKTGVVLGVCIKVIGPAKKRIAYLGEIFLISVK